MIYHAMDYCSPIKSDVALLHATTRMNLESSNPAHFVKMQKTTRLRKYSHSCAKSRTGRAMETEKTSLVIRNPAEGQTGSDSFMGRGFLFELIKMF